MDSSAWPLATVARSLGVNRSRVLRACQQGTVECVKDRFGAWQLPQQSVDALVRRWGRVPATMDGLDRESILVLTALVRYARGLPSARAAAAVSGLSAMTAADRLTKLRRLGLAQTGQVEVVLRGHATVQEWWRPDWSQDGWDARLAVLHDVELPARPNRHASPGLPVHVWQLVWNAAPTAIDVDADAEYLAARVLDAHDPEATAWAARRLPGRAWLAAAAHRGRSDADIAFARLLADTDA